MMSCKSIMQYSRKITTIKQKTIVKTIFEISLTIFHNFFLLFFVFILEVTFLCIT